METLELRVDFLSGEAQVLDLANALNALNGVACVSIDEVGRLVSVSFDPAFGSAETIRSTAVHSGYPLQSAGKK